MKILGIQTQDFAAYHDLVQHLRERGIRFESLSLGDEIPPSVGVLVTTAAEASLVAHPRVVVYTTPEDTLEDATRALTGATSFRRCVVGIDPGERPGVAILADGRVLRLVRATSPEAVRRSVRSALQRVPAQTFLVRIGNGAPTHRDRILHALASLDVDVELVDETRSTPAHPRGVGHRDTAAATTIALLPGVLLPVASLPPVRPTPGELRDIQRKSRLASHGRVTISRALARHVALGRITLEEAIRRQKTGAADATGLHA